MDEMAQLSCTHFDPLNIFVWGSRLRMIERVNFFNLKEYLLMVVDYRVYLLRVDNFLIELVKFVIFFNSIISCLEFNRACQPSFDRD